MIALPDTPGAYALQFSLNQNQRVQVGRLGQFHFPAGDLIYIGSARGPGGLRARVNRHLAQLREHFHWHIDYLHPYINWRACYFLKIPPAQPLPAIECQWSQALAALPGARIPAPRFGASDCRAGCPAHLIEFDLSISKISRIPDTNKLRAILSLAANHSTCDIQVRSV